MSLDTVDDLLRVISYTMFTGAARTMQRPVTGYSTDSRSLKKGNVFFALKGETFDGHDYVDAVERRASAIVVSERWFASRKGGHGRTPLFVVDDPLAAYGQVARAHRRAFAIPMIAVAGSNGKTTTKELIADLLSERHNVLRTEGNLNNLIGVPATMLRLRPEHTAAVIEIGTNMPGEIAALCAVLEPTHGIITNIGREHLELLGSLEGVAREEGALFEYLAAHGGKAYVNMNDRHLAKLARKLPNRVTYAIGRAAEIRGTCGRLDDRGAPALTLADTRKTVRPLAVQLATPGAHTAGNALAAAAVAIDFRIPAGSIRKRLESFAPIVYPGGYARLAPMRAASGARILNDTYNANPDSTMVALRTLAAMKPGRGGMRIAVIADMKELGRSSAAEHTQLGAELAAMPRINLVMFHGAEMKRAYRAMMASEAMKSGALVVMKPMYFADKAELSEALLALSDADDIILVKGSRGMRMEDVVARLVENQNSKFESRRG